VSPSVIQFDKFIRSRLLQRTISPLASNLFIQLFCSSEEQGAKTTKDIFMGARERNAFPEHIINEIGLQGSNECAAIAKNKVKKSGHFNARIQDIKPTLEPA